MELIKKIAPHIIAVFIFVSFSSIYFSPLFNGYELKQGDVKQLRGMTKELEDFKRVNGEQALWTNSMFGGMPTYQITLQYPSNKLFFVEKVIKLGLPKAVGIMFTAMLGFYIFALCLRINPWIGIIGALAFGFSTINILYLGAGHITKVNAIAYMAPTLGGLILAFRGNWLLGSGVFALFFALNLNANHLQMTYYLLFLLGAVAIGEIVRLFIQKKGKELTRILPSLLLAAIIAPLPSVGNILSTQEYSKYTTRGETDLTIEPDGKKKEISKQSGLATNYILEYNYSPGEILSVIAPKVKGEKDDYIGNNEEAMANIDYAYSEQVSKMNQYWGGQKMSGGAFYFGVIMFVLFILGLVFMKDFIKWPFIILSFLVILLASNNPGGLNDFFIHKFPLYNKFRDSKMILVLLQVMIPAMAILFLDRFIKKQEIWGRKKHWFIACGIMTLILLIFYIYPTSYGSFIRSDESIQFSEYLKSVKDPKQIIEIKESKQALIEVRIGMFKDDIGRAIGLTLLTVAILFAMVYTKINRYAFIIFIGIVVTWDNMSVSKRYLNNLESEGIYEHYDETAIASLPYIPNVSDLSILSREHDQTKNKELTKQKIKNEMLASEQFASADAASVDQLAAFGSLNLNSNYRVLNFGNPFNETATSYFHKSIGGYHGAKLKRYQEIIDFYISNELERANQAISKAKNVQLQKIVGLVDTTTGQPLLTKENAQSIFDTVQIDAIDMIETPLLNLLNTRYLVLNPQQKAVKNNSAFGNAWFVQKFNAVKSANDEMKTLNTVDLKEIVVINTTEFSKIVLNRIGKDSLATITMTKYSPNEITYKSKSSVISAAVFSEIYYPEGWNCYVDGKKNDQIFRANYFLRGAIIPGGSHVIEWKFEPETFRKSNRIALIGSILLYLLFFGSIGWSLKTARNEKTEEEGKKD
jgi:hypothetical protein